MKKVKKTVIVSLHWGFGFGGVAKYASLLDHVESLVPVTIHNVCILNQNKVVDEKTLDSLTSTHRVNVKSVFNLRWINIIRNLIEGIHPDIIITHGFNAHFIAWIIRNKLDRNINFIASYHGGYYGSTWSKKLLGCIYEWFTNYYLRKYASQIVAVASVCRDYLTTKKISVKKIRIVHNGIPDIKPDSKRSNEFRSEWGLESNHFSVGVVSRLEPVKGIEDLIRAFHAVVDYCQNARLIIVGSGIQEADLKNTITNLDLEEKVILAGYQTEVPEIINAFDLYVLPSQKEAHSIALLEAMRAGKPIVTTNAGGNTESVRDKIDAIVVDVGDVESLADAIREIYDNRDMANSLALSARQRYLDVFTEEVMLQNTANWLQDCLRPE